MYGKTGVHRVICSGGVFMNVKVNQKILEIPQVEELFIMPSCGDETNSIGAAYQVYAQEKFKQNKIPDIEPLGSVYLGNNIVKKKLKKQSKLLNSRRRFIGKNTKILKKR